jgi:hypothetical protein
MGRDKHRIIVERAEEYFFEMKGMENFYREKAQLPPEKPGQFDLFGPRYVSCLMVFTS